MIFLFVFLSVNEKKNKMLQDKCFPDRESPVGALHDEQLLRDYRHKWLTIHGVLRIN